MTTDLAAEFADVNTLNLQRTWRRPGGRSGFSSYLG